MLGSRSDAEDALQESWVRISRADAARVANFGGWLTTVVARVCLDMLRSRKSRREDLVADDPRTREASVERGPEHEAVLADLIGLALLVVLETLSPAERSAVVHAFLAASRSGDLDGLISLLDPSVVLRADAAAVAAGAAAEVRGAAAVAETFSGRARAAGPALVDDAIALVWAQGGTPRVVFSFTFGDGVVTAIDLIADPDRVARFSIEFLTPAANP